jgi:hypothetical protein
MSNDVHLGELELRVDQEALAAVQQLRIPANFEEVGAVLKEKLIPYSTLIVTPDTIPDAKSARANVNRLRSNIDEYRKTVKKLLSAPAAEFEANCKPLIAMCDEAAGNIDSQVKAFERREKDQKIASLRIFFNEKIGEDIRFLSFEDIQNPKWENKTYSEEAAQKDIISAITTVRSSLSAIHSLHSPFEAVLIDQYLKTRDLAACMQQNEKLIADQERLEKLREQKEAAAKAAAEAMAAATEKAAQTTASVAEVVGAEREAKLQGAAAQEQQPSSELPEINVIDFRVWATQAQLMALREFLLDHGIKYGRVPREH